MTSAPTRPRKWIDAEIDRLNPAEDWAQIYRLMNAYRPNDFVLDLIYAHVFPHFMVPAHGAIPVWRNGEDAKVVNRASLRADTTSLHNMIWWYHGPGHPATKKSVDTINKIHAHYEQLYPGTFQDHSDYVYVWCFSAVTMHRIREKMGLSGLTAGEKVAAHRFWKELAPLFVVPGDSGPRHPVDDYPDDFDGMITWLDDFEHREWPYNATGAKTAKAVADQFLAHHFPRLAWPVMRAVLNCFYADSVLKAYRITPPPRPIKALIRRACGVAVTIAGYRATDPAESYLDRRNGLSTERRAQRAQLLRDNDTVFARVVRASWGRSRSAMPTSDSGCPHLTPMGTRSHER